MPDLRQDEGSALLARQPLGHGYPGPNKSLSAHTEVKALRPCCNRGSGGLSGPELDHRRDRGSPGARGLLALGIPGRHPHEQRAEVPRMHATNETPRIETHMIVPLQKQMITN
jgi:hypothetical protein